MKKLIGIGIVVLFLTSCASLQEGKSYSDMAKKNTFEYYFPSYSVVKTFETLDETYDFISEARIKLRTASDKSTAKGLSAKLSGSEVKRDQPVTLAYFIMAGTATGSIDLSKAGSDLESVLRNAITVTGVYLVFHEGRAISISDFNLASGYTYNSNSQIKRFTFGGEEYTADYPVGFGIQKAFKYLKKETD